MVAKWKRREREGSVGRTTSHPTGMLLLGWTLLLIVTTSRRAPGALAQNTNVTLSIVPERPPDFQTDNGYDVGGSDPICFFSRFGASVAPTFLQLPWLDGNSNDSYVPVKTPAVLLPYCPYNTSLELRGLSWDSTWGRTLFVGGQPSTFQVNFTTTMQSNDAYSQPQNISGVYFRLVLCNALLRGFCSPLVDSDLMFEDVIERQNVSSDGAPGRSVEPTTPTTHVLVGTENVEERVISTNAVRWTSEDGLIENEVVLNIQLVLPPNATTGTYLMITHALIIFQYEGTREFHRIDVGASLPNFTVQVEEPPNIQYVSRGVKVGLGVASALVGAACVFCIGFIFRHRKHTVMKLAQSPFLVGMTCCILISSIFMFTYLPTKDVYSSMRGPLVDVPFTVAAAIILARCWRVHVTLANAHMFARAKSKDKYSVGQGVVVMLTFLARLPFRLFDFCPGKSAFCAKDGHASLRQKATARETVSLVTIIALPDIILQIVGVTVYHPQLALDFNEEANTGRYVCQGSRSSSRWVQQFSLIWMVVIFLSAVAVAWLDRNLPTAFAEKNAIFNTAAVCSVLLLITLMFGETTSKAETSPDLVVFLRCVGFVGISAAMLINILLPKIRRVMSGEKVVVTHLLTKYNQQGGVKDSDVNRRPTTMNSIPQRAVYTSGDIIKLKRDDPLPPTLEKEIFAVQGLLGQVTKLCGEGRTPSEADWHAMRVYVAKLKMELDRVQLDFHDENASDITSTINNLQFDSGLPGGQLSGAQPVSAAATSSVSLGNGLASITERSEGESNNDDDDNTGDDESAEP